MLISVVFEDVTNAAILLYHASKSDGSLST